MNTFIFYITICTLAFSGVHHHAVADDVVKHQVLALLRDALPAQGCIEAIFDVDADRRAQGTFGQYRASFDVETGAASLIWMDGHYTVGPDGVVRKGEARFRSTVIDGSALYPPEVLAGSAVGRYIPAAWARALITLPDLVSARRASPPDDDGFIVLLHLPRIEGEDNLRTYVFKVDERGWPISFAVGDEAGVPESDEMGFEYLDPAGSLLQPTRSFLSRVLLAHNVSPKGCSSEAFSPAYLESAAIEVLQAKEARFAARNAELRAAGQIVSPDGKLIDAPDPSNNVYGKEFNRWRLPLLLVGGLLLTAAGVRLILRGKGARVSGAGRVVGVAAVGCRWLHLCGLLVCGVWLLWRLRRDG